MMTISQIIVRVIRGFLKEQNPVGGGDWASSRVVQYVYVGLAYTGNVRVRGVRTRTRDIQVYVIQVYVSL